MIETFTVEGVAIVAGSAALLVVSSWVFYWYNVGRHESADAEEVSD